MSEAPTDGDELVGRDPLLVEQLVDHREVIERPEVGGEVERQAGPGRDDDAIVGALAVDRPEHRRLAEAHAGLRRQVGAVADGEVQRRRRGIRRRPSERAARSAR